MRIAFFVLQVLSTPVPDRRRQPPPSDDDMGMGFMSMDQYERFNDGPPQIRHFSAPIGPNFAIPPQFQQFQQQFPFGNGFPFQMGPMAFPRMPDLAALLPLLFPMGNGAPCKHSQQQQQTGPGTAPTAPISVGGQPVATIPGTGAIGTGATGTVGTPIIGTGSTGTVTTPIGGIPTTIATPIPTPTPIIPTPIFNPVPIVNPAPIAATQPTNTGAIQPIAPITTV